jgi:hypothetical protein
MFTSQGAPPVSTTPVENCQGINDTGSKFAASTTPVANDGNNIKLLKP